MADAVLNLGLPAPIDIQVTGSNLADAYRTASEIAARTRDLPGVSDVYVPQDLDYPALRLEIDRTNSGKLGLTQREIVQNVITALTSNQMIAPSYWVDPKTGNDYMLTVQYPEMQVKNMMDLRSIPLRAASAQSPARLDAVSTLTRIESPTEVDHYQLRRVIDLCLVPETCQVLERPLVHLPRLRLRPRVHGSAEAIPPGLRAIDREPTD